MARALDSWSEVGTRVSQARDSAGLTQEALAAEAQLERTALAKVELGRRHLNSLELARIAAALGRPIEWFVTESPPSVVSRRAEHIDQVDGLDQHIDALARDIELLIELKALQSTAERQPNIPETLNEAEQLAAAIRAELSEPSGPVHNLAAVVEHLGLYVVSLDLGLSLPDGVYVAVDGAGATVINGSKDAGRRRFTLAHELGHHVMADEYSTDWSVAEPREDREKRINAFAIHFLMPRESMLNGWAAYGENEEPREVAIRLAVEYRVSWTATCTQLQNLGVVDHDLAQTLRQRPPTRPELLEQGLFIIEELSPPSLSPALETATLSAFRGCKITGERAIELLRGTTESHELPPINPVPRDALRSELADAG